MRQLMCLIGLGLVPLMLGSSESFASAPIGIYELRVYTCEPGKLAPLHERFQNHTMRLFEKHGMVNLGYWTPTDAPLSENTLVYLLGHASREAATASWDAFRKDPEWQAVAKASQDKDGKILSRTPEATFFTAASFSPPVKELSAETVYELRTYVTNSGKLGDLHTRFQDHTLKLFEKHGMTNLWYLTPVDAEKSQNTLIYFVAHKNRAAADASWKAFLGDPDWQAAYKASEAAGPILAQRPEAQFLKLTEYSPRKLAAE